MRKKGSGRPKASLYRDDHLLKCTVLKDRKRSLQKLSAELKTSKNKNLSRRTITRRLSNTGFVPRRCVKSHCCLIKTSKTELRFWQNTESLMKSGSAQLCGVRNQDFSCILMVQRGVFEDLVGNTIVNASLPQ